MPVSVEDRFREFFVSSAECQFFIKPTKDGRLTYAHINPKALALIGAVTEDDVIGLTPVEALGPEYGAIVERNVSKALSQASPFHFYGRLGNHPDSPVYDAQYIPLVDEAGQVSGVLGSAKDVTEISNLNDRLLHSKKLESLGELSSSVAHDFKNILTVFQNVLRLLTMDDLPSATKIMIKKEAETTLGNGKALIQRLTAFARKEKIQATQQDVHSLVTSCAPMVSQVLGKDHELVVDLPADLWQACCDRSEFEIALMNLASNARDAFDGPGTLILSARNVARSSDDPARYPLKFVEVMVTDTGSGMPPDVVKMALEPFFTTKDVGIGTGLGLSSVSRFVKDMGGVIKIESRIGEGTCVSMFFPKAEK